MKSSSEMVDSLFQRRRVYEAQLCRKRKILVCTVISVFCVSAVLLMSIGIWRAGTLGGASVQATEDAVTPAITATNGGHEENVYLTSPTGENKTKEIAPFLYLCALEHQEGEGKDSSEMIQPHQAYDFKIFLEFYNIKGLKEAQIEEKYSEILDKRDAYLADNLGSDAFNQGRGSVMRLESYLALFVVLNSVRLQLNGMDNVEQIRVTNLSERGIIDVYGVPDEDYSLRHGKDITIHKDSITQQLRFSWHYDGLNDYLQTTENPTYEDFNDTLHFTVTYSDGTKATASINIEFDESGKGRIIGDEYKLLTA